MYQTMTDVEFRRQIQKSPSPGYLFWGDEDYLKLNALSVARSAVIADSAALAFDYTVIPRASYGADALASALAQPPLFSDKKLIVVSLTFDDLRQGEIDDLCELLGARDGDDAGVVILNVPSGGIDPGYPNRPSALLKRLAEHLVPVRFDRVSQARLSSWAGKHYASHGVSASGDICDETVAYCGTDMFRLASEIAKVSYYVLSHGENTVKSDDLRAAASESEEYDTFALANAITSRRYADALDVLAVMKAQKAEPARIMGEVIRVICDMATVSLCLSGGMPQNEISASTGIKPYPLSRIVAALRATDQQTIRLSLAACVEADAGVKGYAQDYVPIERLICSL